MASKMASTGHKTATAMDVSTSTHSSNPPRSTTESPALSEVLFSGTEPAAGAPREEPAAISAVEHVPNPNIATVPNEINVPGDNTRRREPSYTHVKDVECSYDDGYDAEGESGPCSN